MITALAFAPDGQTFASASNDRQVKVWTLEEGLRPQPVPRPHRADRLAGVRPDGKTLATGGTNDRVVKLWDVESGLARASLEGHTGWILASAFSPDGKVLATASPGDRTTTESPAGNLTHPGEVKLWDVASGRELPLLDGDTAMTGNLAVSPDSKLLGNRHPEPLRRHLGPRHPTAPAHPPGPSLLGQRRGLLATARRSTPATATGSSRPGTSGPAPSAAPSAGTPSR